MKVSEFFKKEGRNNKNFKFCETFTFLDFVLNDCFKKTCRMNNCVRKYCWNHWCLVLRFF